MNHFIVYPEVLILIGISLAVWIKSLLKRKIQTVYTQIAKPDGGENLNILQRITVCFFCLSNGCNDVFYDPSWVFFIDKIELPTLPMTILQVGVFSRWTIDNLACI